jgi:hypothetical protein
MAGQSSGKMPDVGKGDGTEVVDIVEAELVLCDVELLAVEVEAIVLEMEEVKVLDVEEVELLSVEGLDVETAVKLPNEGTEDGCEGLTIQSAFHKSLYLRSKIEEIIIGSSNGKQAKITYLVFAMSFACFCARLPPTPPPTAAPTTTIRATVPMTIQNVRAESPQILFAGRPGNSATSNFSYPRGGWAPSGAYPCGGWATSGASPPPSHTCNPSCGGYCREPITGQFIEVVFGLQ